MQNKSKGKQGEQIAKEYLENKGYKILDCNFHYSKFAEIDIICKKDNQIVFVEVKTRTSNTFGEPIEAVGYKKIQNIVLGSKYYIQTKNIKNLSPRIDIISIILNNTEFSLKHIKNIEI